MNFDDFVKLMQTSTPCIQAFIWPCIIIIIVLLFRTPFRNILTNFSQMNKYSGKVGTQGLEISAEKDADAIAVSAALGAASVGQANNTSPSSILDDEKLQEIVSITNRAFTSRRTEKVVGASILWIEQSQFSNLYERMALSLVGINISLVNDITEATEKLKSEKYSGIIIHTVVNSNTKISINEELERLRKLTTSTIIVYVLDTNIKNNDIIKEIQCETIGTPQELFELILRTIERNIKTSDMRIRGHLSLGKFAEYQRIEAKVIKWLQDSYPQNTIVNPETLKGFTRRKYDYIMVPPLPDLKIAVEIKAPSDSFINTSSMEDSIRFFLLDDNKKLLSRFLYIIAFPDENKAKGALPIVSRWLQKEPLALKEEIHVIIGYLTEDEFIYMVTVNH